MQDNGYRIIKLKNGDNVITRLLEIRKKTLIIERPMQFKTVMLVDQTSGNTTDMLVLKTWIDYSMDRVLEIAADGILALSTPDQKLVVCYEMEKEKEDNPPKETDDKMNDVTENFLNKMSRPQNIQTPSDNINITFNVPQEMAEEIIDMMAEAKSWEDLDNDIDDEDLFPEVKPPKKAKKKKKPDASSKPSQKKNKKDSKDFGNDWSDWSPDPKDYI